MHVAFAAGGLGQGGAEKQLLLMSTSLIERGHRVSVVTFEEGGHYSDDLCRRGAALHVVPSGAGRLGRLRELRRLVRAERPDVLQAAHTWLNPYVWGATVGSGCRPIGAVRSDGTMEVTQNPVWGRLCLTVPGTAIVNSAAAQRRLEAFSFGRNRFVHVVPNAIRLSTEESHPSSATEDAADVVTVLTVANVTPAKRLDVLVDAFGRAQRDASAPLQLWIAGDGPELEATEMRVRTAGLEDVVAFLGRRDDVQELMSCASIYALSSDHEGFPNTVLEAMTVGLPVVATDAGAVPDVVADGRTGYVVPRGDAAAFARALVALADDPKRRTAFGRAARDRVVAEFSASELAVRLEKVYGAMLN